MARGGGKTKAGRKRGRDREARGPASPVFSTGKSVVATLVASLVVGVVAFSAFYPALGAEFVNFDDQELLVDNASFRGFSFDHLRWMFSTTHMGHYHPLTWMSYALDYRLAGSQLKPAAFHLTNVLLHAVSAVLFFHVAIRLLSAAFQIKRGEHCLRIILASAVAALLFAVHPLRVESVAWVSERRDVLSVLFMLASLLVYLRSVGATSALRSPNAYWLCVFLLVCSLLSKAWGMTFFVLLIILDFYPLRRLSLTPVGWPKEARKVWQQKIPFVALGVAAALMAGVAQRSAMNTMKTWDEWGIVERGVQAVYGLWFYIARTFWPTNLIPLYELPLDVDPLETRYLVSYAALTMVAVGLFMFRRRPALLACAVFYVVTLAPVLGFFQSGPQFVADRYSYVSCMGFPLLLAGILVAHAKGNARRIFRQAGYVAVVLVLVVMFGRTWQQTRNWRTSRTLWRSVLDSGIPCATAHLNYGMLFNEASEKTIGHYRKAVEIDPTMGNAWFALGNALKARRSFAESEQAYLKAVKFMTQKHRVYLNLGNLYIMNLDRPDDAIVAYRSAIELIEISDGKMADAKPYLNLGICLKNKGRFEEAREVLEVAATFDQTREPALIMLSEIDG